MQRIMLKAKLHQARVTHAVPDYEGACAISGDLLDLAGIAEYEQIHIHNIENGERIVTYAIRSDEDKGIISMNGAAAQKANVDDTLIICAYANFDETEVPAFKPKIVYLNEDNTVSHTANAISVQLA